MNAFLDEEIESIAILCPSWVGDAIMATPALRLVREARPNATITVLMRPGLDALLAGLNSIDEVVVDDMHGVLGPWRAARKLRAHQPHAGLLLPNSFRSALTLRLGGPRVRMGYGRDGRRFLLTHAVPPGDVKSPRSIVAYYLELVCRALDRAYPDQPRLELAVTDEERDAAQRLLHDVEEPFVLINPGANKQAKRWPAERFGAAATQLANDMNVRLVVTGSPKERDIVQRVIAACDVAPPPIDLVERGVTLGSLKAIIQRAAILITNDTGPRHIAAALATPIVSLFGPTDYRWTDLRGLPDVREHMLLAEPFLPEDMVADQYPQACDIERITVGDVVAAACAFLPGRG